MGRETLRNHAEDSRRIVTIRSKLVLGLLALAAALLVPLLFALRSLDRLHDTAVQVRDREFAASLVLGRMRVISDEMRQTELRLLFVPDAATLPAMTEQITRLAAMSDTLRHLGLRAESDEIDGSLAAVDRFAAEMSQAMAAGRTEAADSISNVHLRPASNRVDEVLGHAAQALRERTTARVQAAADETELARERAALALAIALVIVLAVAVALYRSISRPVRDLDRGMARVAAGDFEHRLRTSPNRNDEFGRLAISFSTMQQRLAELDRLKAEFISVASHELKTPINVIGGYVQLMQDEVYGPQNARQHEVLQTLENQVQGLARLVHQLLDVSRFEAGGGRIDPRPIPLARFIDELEDTFRVLSIQRGIDFRIERLSVLPPEVVWDPDRINEVLGNLLSNAFKFTERGGTVELRIERLNGDVRLEVRDTGAGIPTDQMPRIFEKFFQAENQRAAADGSGGVGLGLAIAKQIVEAHGGTIGVASTVGVGTSFWLTLPVRAGEGVVAESPPPVHGVPA